MKTKLTIKILVLVVALALTIILTVRHANYVDEIYLANLQARRAVNDLDRQIIVARCGQVIDLWQAAIDADTPAGGPVADFAKRLTTSTLWNDFQLKKKMQGDLMRTLVDPPERFRAAHEKVLRQYGYVTRLQTLLEKPTGSLISYIAEIRGLAAEYDQLKAELDVSLPKARLSDPQIPDLN